MILETKIDNSFPTMQFHIERYCIYRLQPFAKNIGTIAQVKKSL